jgi:hypothetical protein
MGFMASAAVIGAIVLIPYTIISVSISYPLDMMYEDSVGILSSISLIATYILMIYPDGDFYYRKWLCIKDEEEN